jgi:bifunctional enzyme CysN/CysC/sulfate adenylyltransferase subunit 1
VTRPSERTPWHDGGTLLAWLESLPSARRLDKLPMRFPVQLTLRPNMDFRGFAGQITSGSLKVGDDIVVMPSGRRSKIAAIDTFDGTLQQESAPFSVAVRLADEVDVSRGDMIVHPDRLPSLLERIEANLVWFVEKPLELSQRYLLKHCGRYVSAQVDEVVYRRELETLTDVAAESLGLNEIGLVRVTCKRPLICDPYGENRQTGAFILVDPLSNDTVAAGMIVGPVRDGGPVQARSIIANEERTQRLGHKGLVALLPAGRDAAMSAFALERSLFDSGCHVVAVERDADVAIAFADAGLIALLHVQTPTAWHAIRGQIRGSGVTAIELSVGEQARFREQILNQASGAK